MSADAVTKAANACSANALTVCYKGLTCCMSHVIVSDASHQKVNMYARADRTSGLLANTTMERLWLTLSQMQALASRSSYIKCHCTGN